MSCDGNRHKYFERVTQRETVQQALGLEPKGAAFAMERLYQIGQSVGAAKIGSQQMSDSELAVETELTRRLFARMRALGLKPPTHSADGLPKPAARFGYGQIERVLEAIESGKPVPEVAASIAGKVASGAYPRSSLQRLTASPGGRLSAVGFDAGGYYRCANCGRFASQTRGHLCPQTASADDLRRMLARRIGLPGSAFEGYQMDALGKLLESAQTKGEIAMLHSLTGRQERVALDGLPQALMNGFIPLEWNGLAVPVITDDMNPVPAAAGRHPGKRRAGRRADL